MEPTPEVDPSEWAYRAAQADATERSAPDEAPQPPRPALRPSRRGIATTALAAVVLVAGIGVGYAAFANRSASNTTSSGVSSTTLATGSSTPQHSSILHIAGLAAADDGREGADG
jgi:uncharacterized protein HemX